MELRIVLAIVVVIGCTLIGKTLAQTSLRRYRMILELLDALKLLRVHIVNMLEPVAIALTHTNSALFAEIAQKLPEAESAWSAWNEVQLATRKRGGIADCLQDRERASLDLLFQQLGESGRVEQDVAIKSCIVSLEMTRDEAKEHMTTVGKLYTSIGMLTGLAIAVLMI